jgi:hypothetical protein
MDENRDEYKEAFERFLECRQRLTGDKTLSRNARKIADFLCRGVECFEDLSRSFRLAVLVRGGKYEDELQLNSDELQAALDELVEKKYGGLFH